MERVLQAVPPCGRRVRRFRPGERAIRREPLVAFKMMTLLELRLEQYEELVKCLLPRETEVRLANLLPILAQKFGERRDGVVTIEVPHLQRLVEAMQARGLEPAPELIRFTDHFVESEGMRAFKELMNRNGEFTAVFAGNDLLALGCYDVLAAENVRCPADVSIVGFNDIPFVDKLRPPLTTVRIPHYEIGLRAAELILERLRDPTAHPNTVLLPPELVVRGSTAPLMSN
jgi:hypothetical protein